MFLPVFQSLLAADRMFKQKVRGLVGNQLGTK